MNAKKLGIIISSFMAIITPTLGVISCGTNINNPQYDAIQGLRGQGSSSVLPIVNYISHYMNDFQYEPSGSGDGLKVGTGNIKGKDFGMTSSLKNPSNKDEWINTRTVTFAIDAIGIALHLPSSLADKYNNSNFKNRPTIIGTELGKLFDNDKSNDSTVTWDSLLEGNQSGKEAKSSVLALGRTGGKEASGTADGFFNSLGNKVSGIDNNKLDVNHKNLPSDQQTAEANSAALNALLGKSSGLTYLSLGFALKHESDGIIVANIKTFKNKIWNPSMKNISNKNYNWTRPFNVIYNVTNRKAVNFVEFLMGSGEFRNNIKSGGYNKNLKGAQSILTKLDFIPLTEKQFKKETEAKSKNIINKNAGLFLPDKDLVSDVTKDILGLEV